jgi:hypothetical protein
MLLVAILDVDEVYRFDFQIPLTLFELVKEIVRVHRVDSASDIFLRQLSLINQLLNQNCRGDTVI